MASPVRSSEGGRPPSPAREDVADALLVERVRAGDVEAYGELARRHMRRAFAIAYRILEHREDSEDVVQEAFIRALERLDRLERGRPFQPWFYRIVINQSLNHRRSRSIRRTAPLPETAPARTPAPDRSAERSELRDWLKAATEALPERQRIIVQLSELEDFTSAEIAEILDVPAGTVRWHLHQARRTLRDALAAWKEEDA
jgi:RNA polymerase sigma-70 factor, ECF subfamily